MLMYVLPGLVSLVSLVSKKPSFVRGRVRTVPSLSPRRWPLTGAVAPLLDSVLERLGGYPEELLDAVDVWRSGDGEVAW